MCERATGKLKKYPENLVVVFLHISSMIEWFGQIFVKILVKIQAEKYCKKIIKKIFKKKIHFQIVCTYCFNRHCKLFRVVENTFTIINCLFTFPVFNTMYLQA